MRPPKKSTPQCFFIRVCSRTCSISLVRCRWRRITLRTARRASRASRRPATKIMRRRLINSRRGLLLPNFHFHVTAAYAILRHYGVDIGKSDFFGAIPMKTT